MKKECGACPSQNKRIFRMVVLIQYEGFKRLYAMVRPPCHETAKSRELYVIKLIRVREVRTPLPEELLRALT